MKAQTLAVCIPGDVCNRKCPYCVSRMTWAPPENLSLWKRNLLLAKAFAERAGIMDVIITGKGEPMMWFDEVVRVSSEFGLFPIVLQTNGITLSRSLSLIGQLPCVDIFAVSVDYPDQFNKALVPLWDAVNQKGKISRATVLLTNEVMEKPFEWWVTTAQTLGVRQLSFREVTIPFGYGVTLEGEKTKAWIKANIDKDQVDDWLTDYEKILSKYSVVRRLPYGAVVRDVGGMAVAFFEYCVQDSNGKDDIRSLIYHQDGHLYTTWNSPASMIF